MKPVQREYAFEDERVPRKKQWLLKVSCNAAPGAVPATMTGSHFVAVMGASQTPLEALMLKRKVMGPSWLQVHGATCVEPHARVSWCKVCLELYCLLPK
jgi:DNA polymerase alpha subunit A